jgi:hypothetical protein
MQENNNENYFRKIFHENKLDLSEELEKWEDQMDEELREYFTSKLKASNFQLNASRIIEKLENDIEIKCKDQINDYRENVFIDGRDNYNAKPKPGRIIEAERSYKRLEKCTEFLYEILSDLNENAEFSERFYYNQFNICRMQCLKKISPVYIPKIQVCLRKCRFYTSSYIERASEDALNKWVINKAVIANNRSLI